MLKGDIIMRQLRTGKIKLEGKIKRVDRSHQGKLLVYDIDEEIVTERRKIQVAVSTCMG